MSSFKKIAILMGGTSEEFDISIETGKEVKKVLSKNFEVKTIIVKKNLKQLISNLTLFKPDAVFNALHGTFGEDGQIQSILNTLKIPYTHSGVLGSSIGMNKCISKIIFEKLGILCPSGQTIFPENSSKLDISPPFVVKPINGGSSIGVHTILKKKDLTPNFFGKYKKKCEIMVEEYIPGREITVGVLNNQICGVTEILPEKKFYDYESKYINVAKHQQNPPLPKKIRDGLLSATLLAHNTLKCNSISRCDFRFNEKNNKFYLLEINTQPGLTKNSLLPEMAEIIGINFSKLCEIIISSAKCEDF